MDNSGETAKKWQGEGVELLSMMAEWRQQHPKARLREIEIELDRRLERLRAKMLEEATLLSEAREWEETRVGPSCPQCGVRLEGRVRGERKLQTHGGTYLCQVKS